MNVAAGKTTEFKDSLTALPVVRGVVRGPGGKPLASAVVRQVFGGGAMGPAGVTDREGRFEMTSDYIIPPEFLSSLHAVSPDGSLASAIPVDWTKASQDLDLRLLAGIRGKVRDPNGLPVGGAKLYCSMAMSDGTKHTTHLAPPRNVEADDKGEYEIKGLVTSRRGNLTAYLRASAEGFGESHTEVKLPASVADKTIEAPAIVLPIPGLSVSGLIIGNDGKPLAGADVRATNQQGTYARSGNSNEAGRFTLTGFSPGRLSVRAHEPGPIPQTGGATGPGTAGDTA